VWQYSEVLHFTFTSLQVQRERARLDPKTVKWFTRTLFTSLRSKENYFEVVQYRSPKTRQVWLLFWCVCEKCCSSHLNNSEAYIKRALNKFSHQNRNKVTPKNNTGSDEEPIIHCSLTDRKACLK
jgi:hypothetical protein